ncbi:MAG: hypothetical protein GF393_03860, partial [Armatimonadia bacterium]|nr:hypothetical protein [Armatimonadia bacterium]
MCIRCAIMLLSVLALSHAHAQDLTRPVLTVGQIAAPTIDGEVGPGEWDGATGVGAFMALGGMHSVHASCFVGADDRGLALVWALPDDPDAKQRGRDGAVWQDDAVEVFLQPEGAAEYYQVIVNAAGDVADLQGRDASWNADIEAAHWVSENGWGIEMRIPWRDLGGAPATGDVWRANFARDIAGDTPITWAPLERSFHEPETFGEMRFANGPGGGVQMVVRYHDRVAVLPHEAAGQGVQVSLLSDGAVVASAETEGPDALELPAPEPGGYVLRIEATSGGATTLLQEVPVKFAAPLEMTLHAATLEADRILVEMDASGSGAMPEAFRLWLGRPEPMLVETTAGTARAELSVSTAGLEGRTVPVIAEALQDGEVVARAERSLPVPADPDWVGSDVGRSSEIPDLWSPVRVEGAAVRLWGREYDFGRGPLLSELTTRDEQVLAAPMRLVTVVGGRQQTWRDTDLRWTERTDERVEGRITAGAERTSLTCDVACEFDGMIRLDVQVTPPERAALEEIVLEIPLREEHARYLHLADASWGGAVATALPEDGWEHHFM